MDYMPELYYRLLEQIQAVDFVLVELTLYLDTHPDDYKAIEQYNQYAQKSELLKKDFESQFGPMREYGTSTSYSKFPWEWSRAPWPWQV